jgi:hypothetical protein
VEAMAAEAMAVEAMAAVVVGAFAEHSADAHGLVDELAAAGCRSPQGCAKAPDASPSSEPKGATKALLSALLNAAFEAPARLEGAL